MPTYADDFFNDLYRKHEGDYLLKKNGISEEEIRKAIERVQKEHPCPFYNEVYDPTKIDSFNSISILNKEIDRVAKKFQDDGEIYIICEMAKLYLQGARPEVPATYGVWIDHYGKDNPNFFVCECSLCGKTYDVKYNYCPNCGAMMDTMED